MRIGSYQLVSVLGRGGTGEVWEARHVETGRRVALKRLPSADPKRVASVLDEARLLSALQHPNVVALEDHGHDAETPWLAVELVEGLSAAQLIAAGERLPEGVAAHVAAKVARALEAAHQVRGQDGQLLGLVHRDVTPGNVLLGFDGAVKLSDFGIAWAKERSQQTTLGTVKGTPAWMAPEQSTAGTVDARADVFSLGCVLHALITGHSPLAGENRLVDLLAGLELPLAAELSEPMREVLKRAVKRDRLARFESAGAFAAALESLAAPDATAQLTAALERARSTVTRTPVEASSSPWLWAAVVAGAVMMVGSVWWRDASSVDPLAPSRGIPAPPARVERVAALQMPTSVPLSEDGGSRMLLPVVGLAPVAMLPMPDAGRPVRAALRKVEPAPVAGPTATGVLAVGGEAAVRAEVFIDGKSVGFAPRLFELPVGAHQLELTFANGTKYGPRQVQVRATDTHAVPQRLVIDAP